MLNIANEISGSFEAIAHRVAKNTVPIHKNFFKVFFVDYFFIGKLESCLTGKFLLQLFCKNLKFITV